LKNLKKALWKNGKNILADNKKRLVVVCVALQNIGLAFVVKAMVLDTRNRRISEDAGSRFCLCGCGFAAILNAVRIQRMRF
jgi:hypothetical protein